MKNSHLVVFVTILALAVTSQSYSDEVHMLLESDEYQTAGSEIFMLSYNSYADLLAGTPASGAYSEVSLASTFSAGGLAYETTSVPEPGAFGFLAFGCLVLGFSKRKRSES